MAAIEWNAQTVIAAIIGGAATFTFAETLIVPLHVQTLKNEIAANADSVARAKATEEKAQGLERQLKAALVRVRSLEKPNLFAVGNPYPIGLGLVKIGQPVAEIEKAYPGAVIKKESGYWILKEYH